MNIMIASDVNIVEKDNRYYTTKKVSIIFARYYQAFGSITLCSRFANHDGNLELFDDITYMIRDIVRVRSLSMLLKGGYNNEIKDKAESCDLIIGRCPSIAAYKAFNIANKLKKPFFSESMGDAWDAYWNHGLIGKLIAPYMHLKMKQVVKESNYALYVTNEYLQRRYPCKNKSVAASNVLISPTSEKVLKKRIEKIKSSQANSITLITTAAVDVWYKGQQYVIKSIPKLNSIGIKVKYVIVGEGNQSFLMKIAHKHNVIDQIEFTGRVSLDKVLLLIDSADIYIQPSLQEGLPRSMIEALSRGCACIGANTAGIPELIEPAFVVKRKSVQEIVDAIKRYVSLSIDEKCKIAERNYSESKKYFSNVLDAKRTSYYNTIKQDLKKI